MTRLDTMARHWKWRACRLIAGLMLIGGLPVAQAATPQAPIDQATGVATRPALIDQAAEPALAVQQLAPGVWVHQGAIADFAADNQGDLANLGFVVGERCIAVIDTGGSRRVGTALLAAIRQHSTLPICFVIATHMHPDHLFGHVAFQDLHPAFVAAARQPAALAVRAAGYLERQQQALGSAGEGTRVVMADHLVAQGEQLDLGGRTLALHAWRTAHTDNDLTIQDSLTGTLFTGDLLFRVHLPVIDGSLRGWLQVIGELARLDTGAIVPGHGPPLTTGAGAFAAERAYLQGVADEVRAALKAGHTLTQTVSDTVPPAGWLLVELYHRRNITAAFAELEWED
jgi:quinoprotein relay system zinc metallohydrolase 2